MSGTLNLKDLAEICKEGLEKANGVNGEFLLARIEDMLARPEKLGKINKRTYFKISLVTGKSFIHYANLTFSLDGTTLVFTSPNNPYQWERTASEQTGFVCAFAGTFLSPVYATVNFPVFYSPEQAIMNLEHGNSDRFKSLFVKMKEELSGDYPFKMDLVRNILMQIIHEAQKMCPKQGLQPSGPHASTRVAALFLELLERQFPEHGMPDKRQMLTLRSPAALAKQLRIHVNHLNKSLKKVTGCTTSYLINDRLLKEAQMLLKESDWTIAEIAWYLGFEEAHHFSRFFKRLAGSSPVAYRKKID